MPDSFKRRLIRQLIVAFSCVIFIALIIIVLNIDINKRTARIEERKLQVLMQAQSILVLSDLKKEAIQAQSDLALLQSALPTRDQLISLPRELEQLAKTHTVDLGFSFGSESPSTETQPGSIRFTMSLGGSLDDLLNFMRAFETNKYFINLSSVDLSRREGTRFSLGTSGEIFTR
jgi:Tfp pilus assembly protein PilO